MSSRLDSVLILVMAILGLLSCGVGDEELVTVVLLGECTPGLLGDSLLEVLTLVVLGRIS